MSASHANSVVSKAEVIFDIDALPEEDVLVITDLPFDDPTLDEIVNSTALSCLSCRTNTCTWAECCEDADDVPSTSG